MTETELRTNSADYNAITAKTMGYQEIRNSAENWRTIMGYIRSGKAKDISLEPKKENMPVIITGSGPSLDNSVEMLKEWKGGIICHYSQAPTLIFHGIEPDYIVALDSICNWEGLQGPDWSKTKTKLIMHPGMWPSLVDNWPNEILLYRQNLGKPGSFTVDEQNIMYSERHGTLQDALESKINLEPQIRTEVTMFACTPPAQLFMAQILRYGSVFLTGCDFAYINGKERFTNYFVNQYGLWEKQEHFIPEREYVLTSNGLKTDPLHMYYKKNFLSACRLSMQHVYTTDKGAVTELPYYPMAKVIREQGHGFEKTPVELRAEKLERYFATVGLFVMHFDRGFSFVEVKDPLKELPQYIIGANRQYICSTCGTTSTANNDDNYTGTECAVCKKKTVGRINYIDPETNMKRIKNLLEYAALSFAEICKKEKSA